ncbi:unnamed protein product [Ceratitis capitata]|uniref:(Mediterranean fruit fly) hypothetical protein n=1 Tax=Ceratitis capitata TaxID=7213 RepID=A0A811UPI7_CERCA|nr:unnamed protein product [Ceratitis capitata]
MSQLLWTSPASAKECPKYLQQKEILKIKTQYKCNFKEARRLYKIQHPLLFNDKQSYTVIVNSDTHIKPNPTTTNNSNTTNNTNNNNKTNTKYSAQINYCNQLQFRTPKFTLQLQPTNNL